MIFPLRNHPGEKAFSDAVNVYNSAELTRQEEILLRGLKVNRLLILCYCCIGITITLIQASLTPSAVVKSLLKCQVQNAQENIHGSSHVRAQSVHDGLGQSAAMTVTSWVDDPSEGPFWRFFHYSCHTRFSCIFFMEHIL